MRTMHALYLLLSLIISPIFANGAISEMERKRIYEKLYLYEGPRAFLLCYPSSGSTWLRYCLEWITQRPSLTPNMHGPIGWIAGFPIDLNKAPIHRAHNKYQTTLRTETMSILAKPNVDKLILLVRNPHETIGRYNEWRLLTKNKHYPQALHLRSYFEIIEFFETWPTETRLLIYYEDLITAPRETLTHILNFLEEPLTRLEPFMQEYQAHKKKSVDLYVGSISKGDDILFHSKKISLETLCELDAWIEDTHPHIWNTYLKKRFSIMH